MGFPGITIVGGGSAGQASGPAPLASERARLATIHTPVPRPEVLARNLSMLRVRSQSAAEAVLAGAPGADEAAGIQWSIAPDGGLTGTSIGQDGKARRLASARGPLAEADALAGQVDLTLAGAAIVRGFGCGHHVAALARRFGAHGCVVVLEPDVAMLRGVLERVDCTPWLESGNVVVITDPEDTSAISRGLTGLEALVSCGTRVVDHPPSMARLGEATGAFARSIETVVRAIRTNVVTTLVQMDVTVRNLLQNLRWYAFCPGVADLAGSMRGRTAVVVSAGPSLAKNIDLLSRPGVRDRVVIIAVQTVLKTLLARGIRPHFVTALDYHEISRRFYEGLTSADVEGVTLVVEPKANPAILEAFPGQIRCAGDDVLERVLGEALAREVGGKGRLQPGATVAHLSYYLARHLGCDPVVLIGQDLGFTDHQYYAPGAAIHTVWGCELGEFRTLEMLEWERIGRMRSLLRRVEAQGGGHIYTDEQMATYLVQFERDFARDQAAGLTTIDATEGGVRKRATRESTLLEALGDAGAPGTGPVLPRVHEAPRRDDPDLAASVAARLREMMQSARRIEVASAEARAILDRLRTMIIAGAEQGRVDRLVLDVQAIAQRASKEPAYWLVQHINQTGQLNRFKADRAIEVEGTSGVQRQGRQVERDLKNVEWLGEAASHSRVLIEQALEALTTGRLQTRDQTTPPSHARESAGTDRGQPREPGGSVEVETAAVSIVPTIVLEAGWDGEVAGRTALEHTAARLAMGAGGSPVGAARAEQAASLMIVGPEADVARAAVLMRARSKLKVTFHHGDAEAIDARREAMQVARLWSRHAWRGGIANLTCHDPLIHPTLLAAAAERAAADGLLIAGSSWCLLDPGLVGDVMERARGEAGRPLPLAFSQATPGLSPLALATASLRDLSAGSGPFATVGAMLGYIPIAPQSDPIAKAVCVQCQALQRDVGWSLCADDPRGARVLGRLLASGVDTADVASLGAAWEAGARSLGIAGPVDHVVIGAGATEAELIEVERALTECAAIGGRVAVTIRASRNVDPMDWREVASAPAFVEIAQRARRCGAAGIHVRTRLAGGVCGSKLLMSHVGASVRESLVHVVSIDAASDDEATFRRLEGWDGAQVVRAGIEHLLEHRGTWAGSGGLPRLWVVPRITRRDEVLDQIESFYDRWLLLAGAAVIDPPPPSYAGRLRGLPRPARVESLESLRTRTIGLEGGGVSP